MRLNAREAAETVCAIAGFWSVARFANEFVNAASLPVPGFVFACLTIVAALASGRLAVSSLEPAARVLTRHLPLFLIPVAGGLLDQAALLAHAGLQIAGVLLGSAVAGIVTAGHVAQFWLKRGEFGGNPPKARRTIGIPREACR